MSLSQYFAVSCSSANPCLHVRFEQFDRGDEEMSWLAPLVVRPYPGRARHRVASIYCTPHAASSSISFRRIVSAIRLAAPFHFSASWPTWVLAVLVSQLDYMGGLVANALLFAEPVHLDCELFQIRVRTEWTEGTRQPARCKARPSSKSWAERHAGRSLGTSETVPRCESAQESPALKAGAAAINAFKFSFVASPARYRPSRTAVTAQ